MNKKIIIGIIVVVFVVVMGAFFIIFKGQEEIPPKVSKAPELFNISLFQKDEAELARLDNDIQTFSQDSVILDEIDQTFSDILDEGTAINPADALNEDAIIQEQSQADLSEISNAFAADEAALQEIDRTFGDILDEGTVISVDEALNEAAIAQEASQADLSETLDALAADEAALEELDQVFDEVSQ